MLGRKNLVLVAIAMAATLPLVAGESKKCTAATQDCLNMMAAKLRNSGWIGVELDDKDYPAKMVVSKVMPGGPAESAGIQPGDILYALNGVPLSEDNKEKLAEVKKNWTPGTKVTYTVKRAGLEKQVALTLAPMPADAMARYIGQHMLEHASQDVAAK